MNVAVLLFDNFETLDVFGPVEILGRIKNMYNVQFYSENGGMIRNHHGICIETHALNEVLDVQHIFLIPGGPGSRIEVANARLIELIKTVSAKSTYVFTVCTGSAILASSGLLDGRKATSNKKAFAWASSFGSGVQWVREARWTTDGKYYTSSGVSAGMDMTFGFLADIHGPDFARKVAFEMEYTWQENSNIDPFSRQ